MKPEMQLSRREFMVLGGAAAATVLTGCATNPVTGETQLMLVSEQQEMAIDRSNAPHQFSADYGPVQNAAVNAYMNEVGGRIVGVSHRQQLPYSFRALNAVHVNAYTFSAGSVGITRGILLSMEDESELAALLGHEVAHVNCRHMSSRQSKAIVTQLALVAVVGAVAVKHQKYAVLAAGLGNLGSGLLLANYSRQDERQADEWGQNYMVKGGYHPDGMAHLMERLVALNDRQPSALEIMFSSHPMSTERYDSAVKRSALEYAAMHNQKTSRERYMDLTAPIRAQKDAIVAMQQGLNALGEKNIAEADKQYESALRLQPQDYAGLVTMSKIKLAQQRFDLSREYALRAKAVYPGEAQAVQLAGLSALNMRQYDAAFAEFDSYDRLLPGNPELAFYKGFSLEQLGRRQPAANEFARYLQAGANGQQADYARTRLVSWGYIKQPQPAPQTQKAAPTANTGANANAGNPAKPWKKKKRANP